MSGTGFPVALFFSQQDGIHRAALVPMIASMSSLASSSK
jgi:hypothetical protein